MKSETQRQVIVVLLGLSCITAVLLLWKVDPVVPKKLTSPAQLDSLITVSFDRLELRNNQVRKRTIQVDSLFSRAVYNVEVAPNFSKTTLHYTLNDELFPYGVRSIARVEFPARHVYIHLLVNDNIHRSVIIRENSDLRLQQDQPVVLPGQDSHEVD
jgi:hypothetical protein